MTVNEKEIAETVIELERSLNERWSGGDPYGYFDNYADGISYFDPVVEKLHVGRDAVISHIKSLYQDPHIVRSEYLNPHVIASDNGDLAVLAYNLNTYVHDQDGSEKLLTAWNSTEVYRLIDGQWRLVHSNWGITQSMETPSAS